MKKWGSGQAIRANLSLLASVHERSKRSRDERDLIFGERKVAGSLTGNPATGDATLRFSALSGVSAMIETPAAYAKMMPGKARFRMVLVMNNGGSEGASRQS
jgi:D-arabinose 1-dehydrogenase-like Zn-dependent alcohol dehydrogenase